MGFNKTNFNAGKNSRAHSLELSKGKARPFVKLSLAAGLMGLVTSFAHAAVPKNNLPPPASILMAKSGGLHTVQGGMAGKYTSLLDLRSSSNRSGQLERIVVDVGDEMKRKLVGRLGYYTVEMTGQEVIVSFRQTLNSKISDNSMASSLRSSPYVAKSRLHFEPLTQTTNLILDLKRNAKLHVYSIGGSKQTGKLVLDFSPAVL